MPACSAKAATIATVSFALSIATATHAQVYKCVDRNGHTTYQQSPCSGGQQGGAVELVDPVTARPGGPDARPGGPDALWSAAAREQRVIAGMPKPYVTEALGAPTNIRAPRAGEIGSEMWVYVKPAQTTRIGFQNNLVAWVRSDAPEKPAGSAAVASDRETRVRDGLAVGKTCTAAIADAGAPDREEPLVAGNTTGARYVYTFDAGNANAYAAFVCLNGRVTSVERYIKGSTAAGGG